MKQQCFFCGHPMAAIGHRTIIRDGQERLLTEYVCTNPNCGNPKVLDEPNEG